MDAAFRQRGWLCSIQGSGAIELSYDRLRRHSGEIPKLRIGFIEVRAEWIPYLLVDLAKRLEKKRGKPMVADLMSEQRLYVACQTDDDLSFVLKYSGENNLLIGSDNRPIGEIPSCLSHN
jgi:hypothetical protein